MANLDEQLWWACIESDWAQAAFLLEAGAGTEWRVEENENTAIMLAAFYGSLETVTLLFNRGANIHAQDNNGSVEVAVNCIDVYRVRMIIQHSLNLVELASSACVMSEKDGAIPRGYGRIFHLVLLLPTELLANAATACSSRLCGCCFYCQFCNPSGGLPRALVDTQRNKPGVVAACRSPGCDARLVCRL